MTKTRSKASLLILLCWLVYTCSYIGKLSYSANINQIGETFGVSYAEAGMVSTFFFFAYGIGQVINGIMCKRYNVKYIIFGSLITASLINVLVVLVKDFSLIKYLWLINGIAMSFLWTSLIRLLSETLDKSDIPRSVVAMGTTVAVGTFLVYGMSALFAAMSSFRLTFYLAAAIMVAVALVWLIAYGRLVPALTAERECEVSEDRVNESTEVKHNGGIIAMLTVIVFFAVANNFVKDGLTGWTPDILAATYHTPGWLSILLTLLLPTVAIGGTSVAVKLQKKTSSFVGTCTVLFAVSCLLIISVLALLKTQYIVLAVACFALISCLMAGVNNVITSMAPLYLKDKIQNSGRLAGILNGFCYLGSTLSAYGLGAVADRFGGWNAVFVLLCCVGVLVTVIGCVYLIIKKIKGKAKNEI